MKTINKNKNERVVGIAVFSALAFVVALVCNVIPPVAGFLSLDVKDAIITVAALIYGPVSAVIISFLAALIELITFSTTGWYGFLMNFVSSAFFSLTASLIYKKWHTLNGALSACFSAVIVTTGAMLLMNVFVTPLYLQYIGVPAEAAQGTVADMLPTVLLPFNFAKTLLNSAVVMLIYKPVITALRRVKVGRDGDTAVSFNRQTLAVLIVGACALVVAVTILLIISLA